MSANNYMREKFRAHSSITYLNDAEIDERKVQNLIIQGERQPFAEDEIGEIPVLSMDGGIMRYASIGLEKRH